MFRKDHDLIPGEGRVVKPAKAYSKRSPRLPKTNPNVRRLMIALF